MKKIAIVLVVIGAAVAGLFIWRGQNDDAADQATLQEQSETSDIQNSDSTGVFMNGREITQAEADALEEQYGVKPVSGNYWYDTRSGAFGVVGQGTAGFMLPGHSFGALAANASNGTSGIFINGREITTQEAAYLVAVIGTQVLPGRYFLDANGNAGYEENGIALVNLYAAAAARGSAGGAGGGDNFWSSRFSAGNYNADNSQGYVSVPGVGPVDYGF